MSTTLAQPAARGRLSLDLNTDAKNAIENLRERTGAPSITELIRRSLALYDVVSEHKAAGGSLVFKYPDGREERLIIL